MNSDSLLRDVPSIDEWGASGVDLATLNLAEIDALEQAYWTHFALRLPAFDEDGIPTVPPDEHIVDGFARAWLPGIDESAARRAGFETVAVVPEIVACESCGWGSARYESRVGPQRDIAVLCLCCLVKRGDPILGPGHSIMMLLPDEIPDQVLRKLMDHLAPEARASWTRTHREDGWDSYRRWGFVGPDENGRLYAVILNVQLSVQRGPLDAIELVAQRSGIRHMYAPGGDTHFGPQGLDELDARAFLLRILRREVQTGQARDALDRHFAISARERDERALSALEQGGGNRWLRLAQHPIADSADHQMALASAAESEAPSVVAALARSHPDAEIRRTAIKNPRLDPSDLTKLAAERDHSLCLALLEREDLPAESAAQVVETLLLAGSLDHHAMRAALKRPDIPERLLETAVTRIAAEGTPARLDLAREMHAAPAHRRDAVHTQLLQGARKIKSTAELIEAIIGDDERRVDWLSEDPSQRVRALMGWFGERRRAEPPGSRGFEGATGTRAKRATHRQCGPDRPGGFGAAAPLVAA